MCLLCIRLVLIQCETGYIIVLWHSLYPLDLRKRTPNKICFSVPSCAILLKIQRKIRWLVYMPISTTYAQVRRRGSQW
jgi:hypothetical protein